MASYTALDPSQLQQKNLDRAVNDTIRDKKMKMEQVETHPGLSKILKRPRIDDSSDDSSNGSIGANDASGSKKIHSSNLPPNIISNSSIIITPIIKPANPSSSLTTLLSQSSPLMLSTKPPLNTSVDLPNILTSISPLGTMDPPGEPVTLKLPVPVGFDPSISKLAGRHPDINDVGRQFNENVAKWKVFRCTICSEGVPYNKTPRHGGSFKCAKCSQTRLDDYFGTDDANPGSIPLQLRQHMLTFVEEQLISLVCVNQYVYLRGKGGIATKGHCINFAQDILQIASILPRLAEDVSIVIIRKRNASTGVSQDLKVRRNVVLLWLTWLKANSPVPGYKNLEISQERIDSLPDNDEMPGIRVIETDDDPEIELDLPVFDQNQETETINGLVSALSSHSIHDEDVSPLTSTHGDIEDDGNPATESGVTIPVQSVSDEANSVIDALNMLSDHIPYPPVDTVPLSEYNTPYLASMAFPTLFPFGRGDPFGSDANSNKVRFLVKIKHLLNYCEMVDDRQEYRFSKHARFVLWLYNINYRHRTLSQGKIYLQKHPDNANLTIEELKAMIRVGNNNPVLNNIQRYMANIPI